MPTATPSERRLPQRAAANPAKTIDAHIARLRTTWKEPPVAMPPSSSGKRRSSAISTSTTGIASEEAA